VESIIACRCRGGVLNSVTVRTVGRERRRGSLSDRVLNPVHRLRRPRLSGRGRCTTDRGSADGATRLQSVTLHTGRPPTKTKGVPFVMTHRSFVRRLAGTAIATKRSREESKQDPTQTSTHQASARTLFGVPINLLSLATSVAVRLSSASRMRRGPKYATSASCDLRAAIHRSPRGTSTSSPLGRTSRSHRVSGGTPSGSSPIERA
jgi:hypothetical protein